MREAPSGQHEHPAHAVKATENLVRHGTARDDVDLGTGIDAFQLLQQRRKQQRVAQRVTDAADQDPEDARDRQLPGVCMRRAGLRQPMNHGACKAAAQRMRVAGQIAEGRALAGGFAHCAAVGMF